ncbi:MAG: hypothetical protein MJZ29_01330 [Bacteroidaceae bacterium]|nr:hypothetical protein [Bacteroidaceae bacterium]
MKKNYISPDILSQVVSTFGSIFEGSIEVDGGSMNNPDPDIDIDDPNDII